jgi:hypothetical protein
MPASRPGDGGFQCFPSRLGKARQHRLGQAVHEREQGLLGSPEAKDLPPDLLDAGRESFFGSYQFLAASR